MATPPWSREERDAAIRRGPHKSAHGEREFLLEEILDFYDQGYWAVLLYDDVRGITGSADIATGCGTATQAPTTAGR